MSEISVILGKPKEGFNIVTLSQEALKEALEGADEHDSLFYIVPAEDSFYLIRDGFDRNAINLNFLPDEEQVYLIDLMKSQGHLSISAIYRGWTTSNKYGEALFFDQIGGEGEVFLDYSIDEDGLVYSNDDTSDINEDDMQVVQFIKHKDGVSPEYNPEGHHAVMYGCTAIFLEGGTERYLSAPQSLLDYLYKHIVVVRDGPPPVSESTEDTTIANIKVLQGKPQHGLKVTSISKDDYESIKSTYPSSMFVPYTIKNHDGHLIIFSGYSGEVLGVSLDFLPDQDKAYLLDLFNYTDYLSIWKNSIVTLCYKDGQGKPILVNNGVVEHVHPSFEEGKHQVVQQTPLAETSDFINSDWYLLQHGISHIYLRGDKDIYSAPESLLNFISQFFKVIKE